ncbi:NHL repeat-containing protein [Sedimenticola selenatireducens]|uniref:NHL repeat-containing protein n=1 Tax=Sedimenticola selenatireducens TaxID=191960 RepID=UPI000490D595|nr:NHL repeat-containing protein [Sedimenticola selenatireducens]
MKWSSALKVAVMVAGSLAGVLAVAWFIWAPSPRVPSYSLFATWGEQGSGPGQFNEPTGIAVHDDEVFVSDARNARIQVFDTEGHFKRQFGGKDDETNQLGRPMNLTVHQDELYVADYWNDRIEVFALDGTPRRSIGRAGSDPGEFSSPGGVAVAQNGDLYVADFYNQRVQHLKPDGRLVSQWGQTGKIGLWAEEFNYPTDVAVASDGTIYIADGYNDRIQVFGPDGEFLRKWGGPFGMNIHGPFNGWFATVTSIALGPDGNLFAADYYYDRVQKFLPDGTFLTAFGTPATGPAHSAIAVDVDNDSTVYVANYDANRIEKWRPTRPTNVLE